MCTRRIPFFVPLTIGEMIAADIKGVAEIHFGRFAKPEIRAISVDGRSGGGLTQRRLETSHPLHGVVAEGIWKRYAKQICDMADEVERDRQNARRDPQQRPQRSVDKKSGLDKPPSGRNPPTGATAAGSSFKVSRSINKVTAMRLSGMQEMKTLAIRPIVGSLSKEEKAEPKISQTQIAAPFTTERGMTVTVALTTKSCCRTLLPELTAPTATNHLGLAMAKSSARGD